jgi:signal peptidase I
MGRRRILVRPGTYASIQFLPRTGGCSRVEEVQIVEPQIQPEPQGEIPFQKSTIRDYFESIVITAIIALFATTFVVQAFKIPTGSMESNLLIGDHLLVNKFIYGLHDGILGKILPYRELQRGDVIVFKYPKSPDTDYVKRLIGLPGETVEMKGRTVLINGKPLEEKYTQYIDPESIYSHYGPYEVPQDQYFAMGDNRDNSLDSRWWGFVPRDHIVGKALLIYWSFETPRDEYLQTGFRDRLSQIRDVALNFFTKTRWDRTFKVIR